MKEIKIGECLSHTKEVLKCEYKGVGGSKPFLNSYLLIAVSYGSHKHIFCFNFYANLLYIFTQIKYHRKCAYVNIHLEKCTLCYLLL